MSVNIGETLTQLWHETGLYNFVQQPDPALTTCFEQFLDHYIANHQAFHHFLV